MVQQVISLLVHANVFAERGFNMTMLCMTSYIVDLCKFCCVPHIEDIVALQVWRGIGWPYTLITP